MHLRQKTAGTGLTSAVAGYEDASYCYEKDEFSWCIWCQKLLELGWLQWWQGMKMRLAVMRKRSSSVMRKKILLGVSASLVPRLNWKSHRRVPTIWVGWVGEPDYICMVLMHLMPKTSVVAEDEDASILLWERGVLLMAVVQYCGRTLVTGQLAWRCTQANFYNPWICT